MLILLFCTHADAKKMVPKLMCDFMSISDLFDDDDTSPFGLVESRTLPERKEGAFKDRVADIDSFQTEWIDASEKDCQLFCEQAKEKKHPVFLTLIIADKRGAQDDTVLVQHKAGPGIDLDEQGRLPLPEQEGKWQSFRVDWTKAHTAYTHLHYCRPAAVYPMYYKTKDEITDKKGVFDVDKAWVA
ncbi:hypothetical protein F4778DRAFT_747007 [Xylariomycetidae sp. FL2044]|nr:hypothetical protein F4778DRAFT_747007 [Xylariomycetidae sp. FL2044]